jgi:CDGSH-type Zn-finger protein
MRSILIKISRCGLSCDQLYCESHAVDSGATDCTVNHSLWTLVRPIVLWIIRCGHSCERFYCESHVVDTRAIDSTVNRTLWTLVRPIVLWIIRCGHSCERLYCESHAVDFRAIYPYGNRMLWAFMRCNVNVSWSSNSSVRLTPLKLDQGLRSQLTVFTLLATWLHLPGCQFRRVWVVVGPIYIYHYSINLLYFIFSTNKRKLNH